MSKWAAVGSVVLAFSLLLASPADARRRRRSARKPAPAASAAATVRDPVATAGPATPGAAAAPTGNSPPKGAKGPKVMDFTGLDVEGKLRTPQLLYFLGRAQEELDRASLEKRSFMPELDRSVDQGGF